MPPLSDKAKQSLKRIFLFLCKNSLVPFSFTPCIPDVAGQTHWPLEINWESKGPYIMGLQIMLSKYSFFCISVYTVTWGTKATNNRARNWARAKTGHQVCPTTTLHRGYLGEQGFFSPLLLELLLCTLTSCLNPALGGQGISPPLHFTTDWIGPNSVCLTNSVLNRTKTRMTKLHVTFITVQNGICIMDSAWSESGLSGPVNLR